MGQFKGIAYTIIATFLGVGYCPVASGTAASAVGLFLIYVLNGQTFAYIGIVLALFGVGVIASNHVEKLSGQKDPGIVVIDEVVGVMIAMLGIPLSWPTAICGFFLFRAFDMFKIYPINKLEAIPGGMGIMLDDVMAGLYTNIVLLIAVHWAGSI